MAYTSLIPVRRLDRAVKYVRDKSKTTKPSSLEEAVDYALNRDKTESVCFETGLSCLCEAAFGVRPLLPICAPTTCAGIRPAVCRDTTLFRVLPRAK